MVRIVTHPELEAELSAEAEARTTGLATKADAAATAQALVEKADATAMATALAGKADAATVEAALSGKASTAALEALEASVSASSPTEFAAGMLALETAAEIRDYIDASSDTASRVMSHKTADQSFASTTLANVTELAPAVGANTVYRLYADLFYNAVAAADLKLGWTLPAGASLIWDVGDGARRTEADTPTVPGDGTDHAVRLAGLLTVAGTAGAVQLRAAQAASDATATKVLLASFVELWSP